MSALQDPGRAPLAAPELPAAAQAVLAQARRYETPCGDGSTVWHAWGEGAPLVLLHGGSGSWNHWLRNVLPLAASGRRVWVPDLPGFGDSALPPGRHDADGLPTPLAAGVAQLLGAADYDLVGFSFGGMVAGLMAADHGAHVRRLVIVGAPALGVPFGRQVPLKGWRHLPDAQAQDAVHRHNLQALMVRDPDLVDDTVLALHRSNVLRDRMPGRRLSRTDLLARTLERVDCPVHAIFGRADPLYEQGIEGLSAVLPALARHFTGLDLIDGAGHWVQYESAAAFDARLLAALGPA